jgi:uncharacterized membrane protein YphA (DoxX/SURF4 family)
MPYTDELFLIGRILLGGYFLKSGIAHFTHRAAMTGYAQSKGVPSPALAVAVSGALLLVGGAGVLLGSYVPWAVLALVLFFVPVTFLMHAYWKDTDPMTEMGNQVNFWKNVALLGAVLCLLAIPMPWPFAV